MRKFITGSMFVLGVASLPVSLSTGQARPTPTPDYRKDPRFDTLRKFFHQGECPAEHYSAAFLEAADVYGLDWRLLPSLAFIESTGGKAARYNNLFGWDEGRARFATAVAGIHAVGYSLSHLEIYRNKRLDGLLATYNPNADYGMRVKSVMRRIAAVRWGLGGGKSTCCVSTVD